MGHAAVPGPARRELLRQDGDERRAVTTDAAVEVVRRHARREAGADDGEDAVDEGFGRNVHRAARREGGLRSV
ncbi:MAG: hypothetical protein RLZZ383_1076 [Pseudomonadota bacterium]